MVGRSIVCEQQNEFERHRSEAQSGKALGIAIASCDECGLAPSVSRASVRACEGGLKDVVVSDTWQATMQPDLIGMNGVDDQPGQPAWFPTARHGFLN